jgi:proteic killer suppression protein
MPLDAYLLSLAEEAAVEAGPVASGQPERAEAVRRMLEFGETEDLRVPPVNQLELLKGGRAGTYSIRIDDQWRICFAWRDGDAQDVEIADYH